MAKRRDGTYFRKDRKQWYVSYVNAAGRRIREPAPDAKSWEEAQTFRADRLRDVRETRNLKPGEVRECHDSFVDVADRFLGYQKARLTPKAYIREEGIVKHLKDYFTGKLTEVTPGQVSDYVTMRLGKVSKSSTRKELISLKHLYRLACGEWKLMPRFANPTLDVRSPKFNDERKQYLTPDQFRDLLLASSVTLRPIFALLTATGMRRSELLTCKWKYVDKTRILLPVTKNGESREVHLNKFSQQVLAFIPKGKPNDLLFPDISPEAVSMGFHRVCQRLGFVDIRLHDLRHCFGTWLRQRGTELDVIAAQLGHKDLRMTKRYSRIAASQVSQAVNDLDGILGKLPIGEQMANK